MNVTTTSAPHAPREQAQEMQVVDCDVHPLVNGGMRALFPYMTQAWQEWFIRKGRDFIAGPPLTVRFAHPAGGVIRVDTKTPGGLPGGSDPDYLKKDLIEKHGISFAILNSGEVNSLASILAARDESVVITSAFNDYFLDKWELNGSGPLRLSMCVPSQDPAAAVTEIKRIGRNPAVASILLPLLNIRMGSQHYHPIYEAAQEYGLPIMMHVTGADNVYIGAPTSAVGVADSYVERWVGFSQIVESNIASLVFTGTLERFPNLRFVFVEYGFSFVLPLMWRMDKIWRGLRYETPWVKKSPIDYVHKHIRFTTQPLDEPSPEHLAKLIEMLGYDLLLFATDYPHWDNDMPNQSLRMLPPDARRKVFSENAMKILRL